MKIICSIGPNSDKLNMLDEFIKEGMNVMRFNFSHAEYDKIKIQMDYVRKKYPYIQMLEDLQGNKIRVSSLFKKEIRVLPNDEVYFCSENFFKSFENRRGYMIIPLTFEGEFSRTFGTKKILMKDASIEFEVVGKGKNGMEFLKTIVRRGGIIREGKGVNIPGIDRANMGLTEKDKYDIIWGLKNKVDIICLSYVTKAENMVELKKFIQNFLKENKDAVMPKLWAKIECKEGVENFKEILSKSDGIMLGRGDLFAELNLLDIPKAQEDIVKIMRKSKKDLIVATYILESMKKNMIPTVTEVNDIYTFIKGRVSGFMLSGEVSVGKYPVLTIKMLKSLIDKYSLEDNDIA